MKKAIRYSLTAIITMIMCLIIAPSAFAEDTVYTTSDVTGGVRIDSVTTTETILEIPEEIDGKVVVALGAKAFEGTPIEEITVPAGVTSMYSYPSIAFYGMNSLKKVTFAEGMRTIPESALENCSTVTEVVLPESITTISAKAFYGCSALETINLPDSITSIGDDAFRGCLVLTGIELPDDLTYIGNRAFAYCEKIDALTLPLKLQTISSEAFYGTSISEITIPSAVTSMYNHVYNSFGSGYYHSALAGMQSLEKVTFADGTATILSCALFDCTTVKEVVLPSSLITISSSSFSGCSALETVVLPESMTEIGASAFYGCNSLETINLPDSITSIGDDAFRDCSKLSGVELPEKLITIGNRAFANCSKIDSLTLPSKLQTISSEAFYGTSISEITIPATVTSMYNHVYNSFGSGYYHSALEGMSSLKKVTFADGMTIIPEYALVACANVKEVNLSSSLRIISDSAFSGCSALAIIVLPETVTQIDANAFYGCSALETINFPDKITTIGDDAFRGCSMLTGVELSEDLTYVGNRAFANCSKIDSLTLPSKLETLCSEAFYGTAISEITIPATVTSMYNNVYYSFGSGYYHSALEGMSSLKKVTFADGMTTIPECALLDCVNVKEVVLPSSLTSISSSAFSGCSALETIVLPESMTQIGASAFNCCNSLATINFPDSITSIEDDAFRGCSVLTGVELPDSITHIGNRAFANCSKIDSLTLPSKLEIICSEAFYGTSISEITIPATVVSMYNNVYYSIGSGYYHSALEGMLYLEKVTFSDGMNTVPENALLGCDYLEEVVIYDCNTSLEAMQAGAETNKYTLTVLPCEECQHENTEIRNTVAVTCLENGYTGDTYCTDCDELITEGEVVTAAGKHDYKTETVKVATCAAEGEVGYTCSVCGDSYTEATAKDSANHAGETEIRDAKDATCTENGYTGDTYCTDCDILITAGDVIKSVGKHDYKSETVKTAICVAAGEIRYTCSVCSDSYTEATAKDSANHTGETEIRDVKDATCTDKGYTGDTYCKDCDALLESGSETAKKAHTEVVVKGSAAKCTTPGMTDGVECSVCGTVINAQEEIPATGHIFGEWTVVTAATTTEEGVEERVCSSCDEKETRSIEKLEDNSLVVKTESTIVVDNENMQTTIEINSTYADVIAQIENENVVITNANGETITADTAIGTGYVIIINNIVQYNIVINYDVDGNGKVTAADARLALRASAQLDNLEGVYAQAANVDGNDTITAADARTILRRSAGLE